MGNACRAGRQEVVRRGGGVVDPSDGHDRATWATAEASDVLFRQGPSGGVRVLHCLAVGLANALRRGGEQDRFGWGVVCGIGWRAPAPEAQRRPGAAHDPATTDLAAATWLGGMCAA